MKKVIVLAVLAALLPTLPAMAAKKPMKHHHHGSMMCKCEQGEMSKKAVMDMFTAWEKGDMAALDRTMADKYIEHSPMPGIPATRDGMKQMAKMFRAAFPDMKSKIDLITASGDLVTVRWTMTGTNKGEFMGMPATGKSIKHTGIEVMRVANGKMVEHWAEVDSMAMMTQLGMMPDMSVVESNKAAMLKVFEESWNKGNFSVVKELSSPNFVEHNVLPGQGPGIEGVIEMFKMWRQSFPDLKFTPDLVMADSDKVIIRYTATGTHKGDFMGAPASGKTFKVSGIDIVRIVDGKATDHWGEFDTVTMMQQLGMMPH